MTSGKNGSLRYAMFALALLAVITLGFTAFASEDSYADTGEIKDSENPTGDPIGTYDYTSYVLKLTANGTSSVESIILDGFTDFENATKLVITGFEADIVATSFPSSSYTNLNTILFTGAINTPSIGTWEFNYKTNALTLSATSVSNVSSVSLIGFGNVHKANVTQVTISNFTQDLYKGGEGSIDSSYEDLNGEVYYRGNIVRSSTITGYWLYDYSDKDLLLQKDSSTTQLGNFNATTGPCYAYFFRTVAESATISGYWTEGNHVLNGFTALKSFRATDYTANTLELLAGLSALQSIQFDVITSVDANLASRVSASLVSVTVPAATKVSDNSFKNFTKLEVVNMVKVTTIGASVFEGCTSLKVVNLPELTSLGSRAFYSCSSIASIYFEDLTSVGSEAFRICGALRTVDCPALTTIGNYAFMECGSLASVNTPSSNSIGTSAFASCGALVSITFGSSVAIGQYAFDACSSLTTIDAEDVKSIAYFAFRNCTSLAGPLNFTSLTKLDGHTVEYSPFFGASVEEIHMPALQEMGTNMFYGSNTLKIVSVGTLQTIPTNTFYGCGALTSVTLSGTVTISGSAFYNCTSLQSITFPDTLTDIKGSAFYSSGLTSLNTNKVQNIEASAFVGSSYLKELIIGPGLVTIGQSAFERVPIEGTVDFSAAVNLTTLGTSAMRYSSVEHLVFSKTAIAAATIGSHAFNDCDRLLSVSFGNQVTVIDTNAFHECTQLSTITFGSDSKVVTINASAFNNTPNAKCDIVFPKTLATLSSSAFSDGRGQGA